MAMQVILALCISLMIGTSAPAFWGDPNTDLVSALNDRDMEKIKAALRAGADVNLSDEIGVGATALHLAAGERDTATVQALLKAGANVNARTIDHGTPLHLALTADSNPNIAIVEALLKAGADVNAKTGARLKFRTPLQLAFVNNANIAIVEALLKAGADVNMRDEKGFSPLMRVTLEREKEPVEAIFLLLQAGADVNQKDSDGYTALLVAAMKGHTTIVEALLKAGADVNARTEKGLSPLMGAALGEREPAEAVFLLLQAGADVNQKNSNGYTALHFAAQAGHPTIVEALLEAGANVNIRSEDGWTTLHSAASGGSTAVAQLLLQAGADADDVNLRSRDNYAVTPLELAAKEGHHQFVTVMNQAIETLMAEKSQALHAAIATGDLAAVVAAIEAGADVNQKGPDGRTPIFAAASGGHTEIVQLLLAAGANVGAQKRPPATQSGSR